MHVIAAVIYAFIIIYGLNIRKAYPDVVMDNASEPLVRTIAYIAVYYLSTVSVPAAAALLVAVVLVHLDYLNLGR